MSAAPDFTQNWSGGRNYWPDLLAGYTGKPNLHFLEIGCYEGHTTLWLLENILTDSSSRITVIDTFAPNQEFDELHIQPANYATFLGNTARYWGHVSTFVGESQQMLRTVTDRFDFVYIDGSHLAADVLTDAVLTWPLLKPGGLLVFDDYEWGHGRGQYATPKAAIDAFLTVYGDQLTVKHIDYQVAVEKR